MTACYLLYQIILLHLLVIGVELLVLQHILANIELEELNDFSKALTFLDIFIVF